MAEECQTLLPLSYCGRGVSDTLTTEWPLVAEECQTLLPLSYCGRGVSDTNHTTELLGVSRGKGVGKCVVTCSICCMCNSLNYSYSILMSDQSIK